MSRATGQSEPGFAPFLAAKHFITAANSTMTIADLVDNKPKYPIPQRPGWCSATISRTREETSMSTAMPSMTPPRPRVTRAAAGVLLALGLLTGLPLAASPASAVVRHVDYVVDGDTIRLDSGRYVRLIGIDTPEVGECGYRKAKRKLDMWVGDTAGLANPASVDDTDSYDRLLRYVHASGRDIGLALIRRGLAEARYDSLDGYDHHPRQDRYRRADRRNPKCADPPPHTLPDGLLLRRSHRSRVRGAPKWPVTDFTGISSPSSRPSRADFTSISARTT